MGKIERDTFVGEPITPAPEAMEASAPGEPALPRRFVWRGAEHTIAEVVRKWKDTGPCRHGSGERYVRKHWYEIRTADGREMKIYFERRARRGHIGEARWWLYTCKNSLPDDSAI